MTFDRQGLEKRERPVDSLFISESFRSVNLVHSTAERNGGAGAVSSLQRCLGRQRFASVEVRESKEAKEAAANCPKTKLPSLAQQDPVATGPCIAPPPPWNVTIHSFASENSLLHLLADVVAHEEEKRADDKEPIILAPPPAPSDPLGVDAPPNPADRLKRANQEEALC
jgi:hypothetical protein